MRLHLRHLSRRSQSVAGRRGANVLQAIWINIEKLPQFHPGFTEWTKDRAVDVEVTMPYHPAAIRFFKDQNAWPATMDDAQKKLLALNP